MKVNWLFLFLKWLSPRNWLLVSLSCINDWLMSHQKLPGFVCIKKNLCNMVRVWRRCWFDVRCCCCCLLLLASWCVPVYFYFLLACWLSLVVVVFVVVYCPLSLLLALSLSLSLSLIVPCRRHRHRWLFLVVVVFVVVDCCLSYSFCRLSWYWLIVVSICHWLIHSSLQSQQANISTLLALTLLANAVVAVCPRPNARKEDEEGGGGWGSGWRRLLRREEGVGRRRQWRRIGGGGGGKEVK